MSVATRAPAEGENCEGRVRGAGRARRRAAKVVTVIVIVLGLLCLSVLVALPRLRDKGNAVVNGSAEVDLAGWQAASDAGQISVQRFTLLDGPKQERTAIDLRRAKGKGTWAFALANLEQPATFFQVGRTYRISVWVRDLEASGQQVGVLLANSNYQERPTEVGRYAAYSDHQWHRLERTFVCTAPGGTGTSLYFALPTTGSLHLQFTGATVKQVKAVEPPHATSDPEVVSFEGPAGTQPDPGNWNHEVGGNGWGNDELQTYVNDVTTAHVDGDGHLLLTALRQHAVGTDGIARDYVSARLSTGGKVVLQPGSYVEAPLQLPVGDGVWPAFWLIGADVKRVGWPAAGELDVAEVSGNRPAVVTSGIHVSRASDGSADYPLGPDEPGGTTHLGESADAGWHTYGVYFDGRLVRFYIDHRPTLTILEEDAVDSGRDWPFDRPQYLVLDVAVGGHGSGDPSVTTFPRTMRVGPISIWRGGVPF